MEPSYNARTKEGLQSGKTETQGSLGPRTMELICNIERRKKHLALCRNAFLIWFLLFIPLFVHYLIYMSADNLARISLRSLAHGAEVFEAQLFNADYLLNNNQSLVSYARTWNDSFRDFRVEHFGATRWNMLLVSLAGLFGIVAISQTLKSSHIG